MDGGNAELWEVKGGLQMEMSNQRHVRGGREKNEGRTGWRVAVQVSDHQVQEKVIGGGWQTGIKRLMKSLTDVTCCWSSCCLNQRQHRWWRASREEEEEKEEGDWLECQTWISVADDAVKCKVQGRIWMWCTSRVSFLVFTDVLKGIIQHFWEYVDSLSCWENTGNGGKASLALLRSHYKLTHLVNLQKLNCNCAISILFITFWFQLISHLILLSSFCGICVIFV